MENTKTTGNRGKFILFYPTIENLWEHVWFPFPYLYLPPFLEEAGFEVEIIDARVEKDWRGLLREEIGDAIGFGMTGMSGPDLIVAIEACNIVKGLKPGIPVVWGGHHAKIRPDQLLQEGLADYVINGRGEHSLVKLLITLEGKRVVDDIEGLVYINNGKVKTNAPIPYIGFDYDILPAYHLFDLEKYRSQNNIVGYLSAQGCPFHCSFCTEKDYTFTYRTDEQLKRELNFLIKEKGFMSLFFHDGTFFVSRKRVLKIARLFLEEYPGVKWKGNARANSLLKYSDDELKLLVDSGLRSVFFGVESASQKVLENMEKKITPEQVLKSAKICVDYGFEFYASFMFATPGETVDDLKQNIDLMNKIKEINPNATLQNSVYIPLPGTDMYYMCLERGFVPPKTTLEWSSRDITSNFENRDDISWIEPSVLKEYIKVYDEAFPNYKHVFQREKAGEYESPLKKQL